MTACLRCRKKKRRCDQQRPTCRSCRLAGVECVDYDTATRQQVSRGYVPQLERRIAYLESRLQENGISDVDSDTGDGFGPSQRVQATPSQLGHGTLPLETSEEGFSRQDDILNSDERALVDKVVGLARSAPKPDRSFSQVLLTELMQSTSISQFTRPEPPTVNAAAIPIPSDISAILDTGTISLPTKKTAQTLVKAYFQYTSLNLPLLHEPTFQQMLALVYQKPETINLSESHADRSSRIAVFFVLEVFAVALLKMQKQDPSKISTSLADRYHKVALEALNLASLPHDVEGVQCLLIIAQYSYYHPTFWAAWRTVGAAIRLAVELGMHQDITENLNALQIDTRRRTFWTAYSMDRNLSVAMSMPLCLSDGAISAQFPSSVKDELITSGGIASNELDAVSESKSIALHMFQYRQIQSEIRHMMWDRQSPHAMVNFNEWQQDMRLRVDNWYNNTPLSSSLGSFEKEILKTFEVTHNTAIFHLYQPALNNPSPNGSQAVIMAEAAVKMMHLYQRFFRKQQLTIYWQTIENIFSAGTALMLAYVELPEVREAISRRSLETTIRTCSSLLWGLVERFPSFQGKRDAFDISAAKVLEDLSAASLGNAISGHASSLEEVSPAEQSNDGLGTQADTSFTFGSTDSNIFQEAVNSQQSWLQFLTPDDFTLHLDQESLSFQNLDIMALLNGGGLEGNNVQF